MHARAVGQRRHRNAFGTRDVRERRIGGCHPVAGARGREQQTVGDRERREPAVVMRRPELGGAPGIRLALSDHVHGPTEKRIEADSYVGGRNAVHADENVDRFGQIDRRHGAFIVAKKPFDVLGSLLVEE